MEYESLVRMNTHTQVWVVVQKNGGVSASKVCLHKAILMFAQEMVQSHIAYGTRIDVVTENGTEIMSFFIKDMFVLDSEVF